MTINKTTSKRKLQVGAISFINALPFFFHFNKDASHSRLFFGNPETINCKMHSRILDAGIISSAYFLEEQDRLEPLLPFGIAAHKKVDSVLFYMKEELSFSDIDTIYLPTSSRTAIALLKIICQHLWKISPTFCSKEFLNKGLHEDLPAFLLLGDTCLKKDSIPGYRSFDLAALWYELTKKPFVFALFAIDKTIKEQFSDEVSLLVEEIQKSFLLAKSDPDSIIKKASSEIGLEENRVREYYETLQFELHDAHFEGLNQFNSFFKKEVFDCE